MCVYVCIGKRMYIHILLILNNVALNRKYEICSKVVLNNNKINFSLKIAKKLIRYIENIFFDNNLYE